MLSATWVCEVRELAGRGDLADRVAAADQEDRRRLTAAMYEIALPVVFSRLTRGLELRRGHGGCAASFRSLADECSDRFQDDLEAVVTDALRHASTPIRDLEAWICSRITVATVDAHRRRRGERGALQRPRLPIWLRDALGRDPWLTVLATEMLVWVGVPATAGIQQWPLDAWSQRRAGLTGDWRGSDAATVAREVGFVEDAMRRRPDWHSAHVETPLGRKQAPVLPAQRAGAEPVAEPVPLRLVARHEADDARLLGLATVAVEAIAARISRGDPAAAAVAGVLRTVFEYGTGSNDIDRVDTAEPSDDERVLGLIADPAVVARIVDTVLDIVGQPGG